MQAAEQIDTLMSREQVLLDRMLYLAHTELANMENGSDDSFPSYLEEAESIRELVDALEGKCDSLLPGAGVKDRAELLPDKTAHLRGTLEELLRTDKRLNELAVARLNLYKRELLNIRRSGKQISRYVNPFSMAGGVYIDTRK